MSRKYVPHLLSAPPEADFTDTRPAPGPRPARTDWT